MADVGELRISLATSEAAVEPISVEDIQRCPQDFARSFERNGCCVVSNALSSLDCGNLADYVDSQLHEAQRQVKEVGSDETKYVGELFGKVRCRQNRWDVKLPHEGPVYSAMLRLGSSLGRLLSELVGSDAMLTELSSIISDPCAAQQPLHADTGTMEPGLMSILVALQPVRRAMGPTVLCPGTHCPAAKAILHALKPQGSGETVAAAAPGYQDEALAALGAVHVACEEGSAVMYDSRLLHCGGANLAVEEGGGRRRVLVATFARKHRAPRGSTCTIRRNLLGRLRLRDFLPTAADGLIPDSKAAASEVPAQEESSDMRQDVER